MSLRSHRMRKRLAVLAIELAVVRIERSARTGDVASLQDALLVARPTEPLPAA